MMSLAFKTLHQSPVLLNAVKRAKFLPTDAYIYALFFFASLVFIYPRWNGAWEGSSGDLFTHARYAYEYFLALKEGQWLPLVAPQLAHEVRLPIFQIYTASGYMVPALLIAIGFAPYHALLLNAMLCCFAGMTALYNVIRRMGASATVAWVLSLLFLFYGRTMASFYYLGMYAEWMAITVLPVILWALFGLINKNTSRWHYKATVALTSVLVAWYIPIHPIHAVFSFNLIVLLACVHAYANRSIKSISYILLSVFLGGLMAAWYWLPIAQIPWREMYIVNCCWFLSRDGITLENMFFSKGVEPPDVGWYLFVPSILNVLFRRRFGVGLASSILFLTVVWIVCHSDYYWIARVFSFAQWDNRLLMPLGLIGAVATADFLIWLQQRGYKRNYAVVLSILTLCAFYWMVRAAHDFKATNVDTPAHITDPSWTYHHSESAYRLIGADFEKSLALLNNDAAPNTYSMIQGYGLGGGFYFSYILTLQAHADNEVFQREYTDPVMQQINILQIPDPSDKKNIYCTLDNASVKMDALQIFSPAKNTYCPINIVVNGRHVPQICTNSGAGNYLVSARMEAGENDFGIINNTSGHVAIRDYTFKVAERQEDQSFRIFPRKNIIRNTVPGGVALTMEVPEGKGGLYQLPIAYWPGLRIMVNNQPTEHLSSDKYAIVIALQEGKNVVTLTNRWTLAKTVSASGLLLCFGLLWMNFRWLENKISLLLIPVRRVRRVNTQLLRKMAINIMHGFIFIIFMATSFRNKIRGAIKRVVRRNEAINAITKKIKSIPMEYYLYAVFLLTSLVYTFPLWSEAGMIIAEPNWDIHARQAFEYFQAWHEGQWLPLVAPLENAPYRLPLFQYYGGNGYIFPALLIAIGLAPYHAIIANAVFCSFIGTAALYKVCKKLGLTTLAAIITTLLGVFYPVAIMCLYPIGLYTEWVAVTLLPVVLWALLGLINSKPPDWRYRIRLMLTSLLIAFYIPIHPIHAVLSLNLIMALACTHAYAQRNFKSVGYILLCEFLGGLMTAWFWLPIALNLALLRMYIWVGLHTTNASLSDVLSPWFRPVGGWNFQLHAPQVGWYFFTLSLLTVIFRFRIRIGVIAAWLFIAVVMIVTQWRSYPLIQHIFAFAQWDYRLFLPFGVVGAVVTADFLCFLQHHNRKRTYHSLLFVLGLCTIAAASQYAIALKYRLKPLYRPVCTECFTGANYGDGGVFYYTYYGVNFQGLNPLNGDITSKNFGIGEFGLPYIVTLKIRSSDPDNQLCPLKMISNKIDATQSCIPLGAGSYLLSGTVSGDAAFVKNTAAIVSIENYYFRSAADGEDKNFRVLQQDAITYKAIDGGTSLAVTIPPGRAGLYQLPAVYWSGLGITVNGKPALQQSSDKSMVVIGLEEGENVVLLYNRWTLARTVSVFGILLCLGLMYMDYAWAYLSKSVKFSNKTI